MPNQDSQLYKELSELRAKSEEDLRSFNTRLSFEEVIGGTYRLGVLVAICQLLERSLEWCLAALDHAEKSDPVSDMQAKIQQSHAVDLHQIASKLAEKL